METVAITQPSHSRIHIATRTGVDSWACSRNFDAVEGWFCIYWLLPITVLANIFWSKLCFSSICYHEAFSPQESDEASWPLDLAAALVSWECFMRALLVPASHRYLLVLWPWSMPWL